MPSFATLMQGLALATSAYAVDPAAVYNGGYNSSKEVLLRVGNGGAGQSGLIGGTYEIKISRPTHPIGQSIWGKQFY